MMVVYAGQVCCLTILTKKQEQLTGFFLVSGHYAGILINWSVSILKAFT